MDTNKQRYEKKGGGFSALVKSDAERWTNPLDLISFFQLLLLNPGFQFALSIRLQKQARKIPFIGRLLSRIIWYFTALIFSSDCSPKAIYGSGIFFPHPYGIVIGNNSVIGDHVSIYQGVTIGLKSFPSDGYPTIENSVTIYAGAKVLGAINVGPNSVIGANVVVTKNVPANSSAIGISAKVITRENYSVLDA